MNDNMVTRRGNERIINTNVSRRNGPKVGFQAEKQIVNNVRQWRGKLVLSKENHACA